MQIENNGTLVIRNAQLGDAAHYRCSASNHLGKASAAARVRVNLAHIRQGDFFVNYYLIVLLILASSFVLTGSLWALFD